MTKLTCFLADQSGSMGSPSTNADEGKEYSRLDFVKQSMIFAVNALSENTLFCVVTFENRANTVISPVKINSSNKDLIIDTIKAIRPTGGTNIMAGLQMCKSICDTNSSCDCSIIMLSDGEDYNLNVNNITEKMTNCFRIESPIKIDTIGYGPDANTQLLVKIATHMSGTYSLCFDASMVGTIIGRALVRTYMFDEAFNIPDHSDDNTDHKLLYHSYRIKLSQILLNINIVRTNNSIVLSELATIIEQFIKDNGMAEGRYFEYICALYGDIVGELTLGCSTDTYWFKWGKAYWTTIGIALEKQYAPNFKDACLQCFGTDNIKAEYARLSDIYGSLIMITPSLQQNNTFNRRGILDPRLGSIAIPQYGGAFNDANAGCFASSTSTLMGNHGLRLTAGDITAALENNETVCVKGWKDGHDCDVNIKTIITTPFIDKHFFMVNNCVLTEHHPIFINSRWQHPKSIVNATYCIINNSR